MPMIAHIKFDREQKEHSGYRNQIKMECFIGNRIVDVLLEEGILEENPLVVPVAEAQVPVGERIEENDVVY